MKQFGLNRNLICGLNTTYGARIPADSYTNRWFSVPFTSVSCFATQRISKSHMFPQSSRFRVWEWPPEGQPLASSSSSCYLQVKGDGLLERCFPIQPLQESHWKLHNGRPVASENTKADKIYWGQVDSKRVVFTKTSLGTSEEFLNWPQEAVDRFK